MECPGCRRSAPAPDRLWVADITDVPTWAGFLSLAVVVDAFSQRRPESVIHHSDHGCQYTAIAFGRRCREAGVRASMGSLGGAYANALCERLFATLECERRDRTIGKTQAEARLAVFDFIEGFYNPHRRHASINDLSSRVRPARQEGTRYFWQKEKLQPYIRHRVEVPSPALVP